VLKAGDVGFSCCRCFAHVLYGKKIDISKRERNTGE